MKITTTTFIQLLLFICSADALIPITVKGKRFIKPNSDASTQGEVFFIKGIDYQPGGSSGYDSATGVDALSNPDACYRDAYAFQQMNINTLRIYSLNPDTNHDECMTIFNNAGIYLILDVNSGEYGGSLNRADPSGSYNANYLNRVFKFIEAFKNYPNVLGFFSGNEVINDQSNYAEITPNYIRAVQRDMKQYIAKHANRTIPVGYSAADSVTLRRATFEYLQCFIDGEENDVSRSDFFGLNSYEWCSPSTWESSGYGELNSTMSNTTLPLLFSEFGCNKNSPRTFNEISDGLFGGLVNTFSGGLVYEYTEEASHYGVVELNSDDSITYREDFENLKNEYANSSIPTILEDDVEKAHIVTCDADIVTNIYSEFGANFTLPAQPKDIADLIEHGVNATNVGKLLDGIEAKKSNHTIYDDSNNEVKDATVVFEASNEINTQSGITASSRVAPVSTVASSGSSSATASSSHSSKGGAHMNSAAGFSFWSVFVVAVSYLI
ncbi:glycoside hydrolase family 72 protein [Wickerhamomyces anomalus NRRL Y-366-8]|uniref:1,3-beta-glucanosyltransferase n=1 Tax=Wickerhamomyces anomalus (strain ATCC 58044 / CBS 1984 / NCYC 433 / NRRL Y-366-8) TaxID=683960 RepID=A0A1E3P8U5_WICAA|nr:glycoside hydrolase family 72 protein [Wickerhamomyces anomalus NRRL Y-366-8]ODQ61829.1 glycoside hydrolase family 72 protein [Wickerhamomyces anomalus NRRL Y-366-8]